MAEGVTWAPIYVIGAGYKKCNGAWVGAGNYEGCLRYKHPNNPIWVFFCPDKNCWAFSNKARYLEDGKIIYKNKQNCEAGASIPQKKWSKSQPPGAAPAPKVINSAFVEGEEVECYSTKGQKWISGSVRKVNEKGTYKCQLKGVRKAINIGRQQIRNLNEGQTRFSEKQFVEINTKSGDWIPAMVGEVKDGGKYYIVLPDGKGSTFPENRMRATELCRGGDSAPAKAAAPAAAAAPTGGASNSEEVAALKKRVAELEGELAAAKASAGSVAAPAPVASSSGGADPQLLQQLTRKQAELAQLAMECMELAAQLK